MKRTAIIIGLATLTTLAAGCGGSDDGGSNTFDRSGQGIDGYLTGAVVCIDADFNSQCDDGEGRTTTGDKGRFTARVSNDFANAPTLVKAIGGETTDSDDPDNPVSDDFDLTAPKNAKVVTPLTTLVQAQASQRVANGEDIDAAIAAAKSDIQSALGNSGDEIDVLSDDYVAARDDDDSNRSTAAARISATARAVNKALMETRQNTRDSLSDSDETNLNTNGTLDTALLNTVSRKVREKLNDISTDVSNAIDDSSDDIEAAANNAADNNPADQPTLTELSQEVEDIETVEDETIEDEDTTGATGGSGS